MIEQFDELEELELSQTAPDTQLPKDLIEHLEERKKHRKQVIQTTELVQKYFISWSLSASGFFSCTTTFINQRWCISMACSRVMFFYLFNQFNSWFIWV